MNFFSEKVVNLFLENTHILNERDLSSDLEDKVNQLMPSLPMMLATLGAVLVLMFILTLFLYKPISKMVQQRKNFIQGNIDESINLKKEAKNSTKNANAKLMEARKTADEIINNAKKEAKLVKQHYIDNGKQEAKRLINQANVDLANQRRKFDLEKKDMVIDAALDISEKLMLDNVKKNQIDEYYEKLIEGKLDA